MTLSGFRHMPWMLALWFAATAWMGEAYAQGTHRPRRSLELSETNSAEILTNLSLLRTKKEGMNELDDQLKALKKLSPDAIFEGNWYIPYVPQSRSAVPSKAIKELLERQNNWGLTSEELGLATSKSDSEAFSVYGDEKNGTDKKFSDRQSSLQQFYDALNNRTLNNRTTDGKKQDGSAEVDLNSLGQKNRLNTRRDFDSEDDSSLPDGIRDKAQKLKEAVNEDNNSIFSPTRARSSFDNFFGLSSDGSTHEPVEPMKQGSDSFIDQFKKTLDKQSAASSMAPGLSGLVPNTDAISRGALVPGLEPFVASAHHDLTDNMPGNSTSLGDPTAFRDINSSALNQWNSLYQSPKLVLPQSQPIAPSTATLMQVPRRKF